MHWKFVDWKRKSMLIEVQHEKGKCVLVWMSLPGNKKQLQEISLWGTVGIIAFQCTWNKPEQNCLKDPLWYQTGWPHPELSFHVIVTLSSCSTHLWQITSGTCALTLSKRRDSHRSCHIPISGEKLLQAWKVHQDPGPVWVKLAETETVRHIPWSLQPQLEGFWLEPTGASVVSPCRCTGPSADHGVQLSLAHWVPHSQNVSPASSSVLQWL